MSIAPFPFFKMKYCMVAVTLFCSASGSRALKAGDNYATDGTDEFREALLRQLKEICRSGRMVDDLCVTPAQPVLQCPDDHITVCNHKDRAEAPCCAKGETAERVAHCRDGAESHDGQCMRMLRHELAHECPPGHALSIHKTECIKEELGEAAPMCIYPDVLSPEGDSCLTTVEQGFEYVCPEGYECVSHSLKKHKSPICSACAKTEEMIPTCGCGEDQEEFEGHCYDAGVHELCQARRGLPRKQAPPKKKDHHYPSKEPYEHEPEVDCKPLGRVTCTCEHPYNLDCNDHSCICINREIIPVVPVCRGQTDEHGNCIAQVQKRLLYQCSEGFTCDTVNKKGECQCTRISSVKPTKRCITGEEHEGKCVELVQEPSVVECPHGYSEHCCDDICSCTKTSLAVREVRCGAGAVSVEGECAYVSKPSSCCDEVSPPLPLAL